MLIVMLVAPVAAANVDFYINPNQHTTGWSPVAVTFNGVVSVPVISDSWYWTFIKSDGYKGSDWNSHHSVTAVHTFKDVGNYDVTMQVKATNGNVLKITKPKYITVWSADFKADKTSVKAGNYAMLKYTGNGQYDGIKWNVKNNKSGAVATRTGSIVGYKVTQKGTYTVTMTVYNSWDSKTITKTNYITVI